MLGALARYELGVAFLYGATHRGLVYWEKEFNNQLNEIRYVIEQVIANFKTCRIMRTDYRRWTRSPKPSQRSSCSTPTNLRISLYVLMKTPRVSGSTVTMAGLSPVDPHREAPTCLDLLHQWLMSARDCWLTSLSNISSFV